MKLNTKIVITILQIALIPWALGGVIAYLSAQEQINIKTYSTLDAFANLQKNRLQDTLQNKQDILNLFTTSPLLGVYMRDFNAQSTASNKKKIQDLIEAPGKALGIRRICAVTTAGVVIASTDPAFLGMNISNESYFKHALSANDESTLKKDVAGTVSQYLAGPLVVNGQTEGVMVVVTDANDIVGISEDYTGLGSTGETLLVTRMNGGDALFLTPTRFDQNAALTRIVASDKINVPAIHALRGEQSVFADLVDYRGVKVFAATRYLDSVGWGIVVKMDQSEALAPIKKLRELFFLIITMIGALMVFIGYSMSRSITGPINALTSFANSIAKGDFRQSIVVASKDEVGMLGVAFNSMTHKLQESYTTLENKVAERTKELKEKTKEAEDSGKAAMNIAADLKAEEEKLAEEKIKAENLANDLKKFKLALDDASDQVIITDVEGTVIYANAAVEKITGYTPEEAMGKKSGVLWKSPMPAEYYKNFWHTIKDLKSIFVGEIQNRRKNGEIYTAMISVSPVLDNDGKIIFFVGIERDITKEKEIDRAKSEFISLASHQMRTPLTAINWYTEMLAEGDAGKLSVKQKKYFDEIYTAAQNMNEIIKSFLHILRLETGTLASNPVDVNLADIARATIKELRLDIEKRHLRVLERYQESLPSVKVDAELIHVVLQNLLSNAAKYSPDKGDLGVSIESVQKGAPVNGKLADRDSLLVSVRDKGIGIPAGDQAKIFGKFFRTENAKRWDPNGNGLGLYMTYKMVELIGGAIWFVSEEGKGTTFYVLLPMEEKKIV